jgi:hypothetical protein
MKEKNWIKTGNIFQALGGGASFVFVVLSFLGITQTQYVNDAFPSVSGVAYTLSPTPLRVILIGSIGMVAVLSFLIAYIARKQTKKRR